jgi:hypothetical protein
LTELAKYEAAERAIAAAEAVDEVLEIRSQAEAWRAYAKQAKNRDLEIKAARIRFRAEKRLGEILLAAKATGQISRGQPPKDQKNSAETEEYFDEAPITRVTLREAGIDHKLSSRAQRLAQMDASEFEAALARQAEEMRSGQARVAMDLLKVGAEEKGRAHRRNVAAVLSAQSAELPTGPMVPAVYLDPPWRRQGGIGDRAYENHYPTMSWPEILDYLRQVAAPRLLPDAWAFMWIPRAHLLAPVAADLEVMVKATGEMVQARLDLPLAYACQLALGADAYSTCFVWTKTDEEFPDDSGSGLIAWDQDELLLLFKRGQGLPKPSGAEKFGSNHRERPREHSRKPDFYRHMIATMVGCDAEGAPLPVLELFARVDAEHPLPPGWLAAGNQAAPAAELEAPAPDQTESSFAVERMPSDAGETTMAAADATSDSRASAAAAVVDMIAADPNDRAPYDAADVIEIDQLAGSDYLQPAELDALELEEIEQLRILSDFCHPKRDATQNVLGPLWQAREMAYQSGGQWQLREAGKARLRELIDAIAPPAPVAALTEPYRAPQPDLFATPIEDCPAPEIVDGALQTRLPVDESELETQAALLSIEAGQDVHWSVFRDLHVRELAHSTTKKQVLTDKGRAFLAQLVAPASVQQQQEATSQ